MTTIWVRKKTGGSFFSSMWWSEEYGMRSDIGVFQIYEAKLAKAMEGIDTEAARKTAMTEIAAEMVRQRGEAITELAAAKAEDGDILEWNDDDRRTLNLLRKVIPALRPKGGRPSAELLAKIDEINAREADPTLPTAEGVEVEPPDLCIECGLSRMHRDGLKVENITPTARVAELELWQAAAKIEVELRGKAIADLRGQLEAETTDLELICGEVSKVYYDLTGGKFSKPNTASGYVIDEVRDIHAKELDEKHTECVEIQRGHTQLEQQLEDAERERDEAKENYDDLNKIYIKLQGEHVVALRKCRDAQADTARMDHFIAHPYDVKYTGKVWVGDGEFGGNGSLRYVLDQQIKAATPTTAGEIKRWWVVSEIWDAIKNAEIQFGLVQQGKIPIVEKMLAEGDKTWHDIGREIGWDGETAERHYGWYATKQLTRLRDELQDIRQAVDGDTSPTHTSLIDQIGTLRNEARRSADAWAELARYKAEHELLYRDICGGDWTVGKLAVGLSQLKTDAEAGRRLPNDTVRLDWVSNHDIIELVGTGWDGREETPISTWRFDDETVQGEEFRDVVDKAMTIEKHDSDAALKAIQADGCAAEGEGGGG